MLYHVTDYIDVRFYNIAYAKTWIL